MTRTSANAVVIGVMTLLAAACVPANTKTSSASRAAAIATTGTPTAITTTAWSTPAGRIATSARSADWAHRYWMNADAYDHNWSIEFGLDGAANDYSIPVYSTADATTTTRVYQRPWNGAFDVAVGSSIPWNPNWLPSDGTDATMVIVNPTTGQEWSLWAVSSPGFSRAYMNQSECSFNVINVVPGLTDQDGRKVEGTFSADHHVCAASVSIVRTPTGKVADTRTYRGNYPPPTGAGTVQTAGLTTPDEVAQGAIKHALKFVVNNRASMAGPDCPASITSPDDPRVGTTCGLAVAPAGKMEGSGSNQKSLLGGMVPQGTRLVIDLSDADIEAWLNSRGYTGTVRSTARIFAVALRDYGLIQTDTSNGPASIQVSGGRNPATAAKWRQLGINDDGSTLLDGLITEARIRVLAPATNHCRGVATTRACWAEDVTY